MLKERWSGPWVQFLMRKVYEWLKEKFKILDGFILPLLRNKVLAYLLCLYYKLRTTLKVLVYCIINFTSLIPTFKMIIQVLFLFASCINFKDFHFETSSVYYKISYTYVILVQNFGQLYSILLMQRVLTQGLDVFVCFQHCNHKMKS